MARISWSDYFLNIAEQVAKRSTCSRLNVGCVITENNRIITTGYNGSPSGLDHCEDNGCLVVDNHCLRTVHAEINALRQLPEFSGYVKLYCTHEPCESCRIEIDKYDIFDIEWKYDYSEITRG